MSSMTNTMIGGGIDLESLSSGELLLLSMLYTPFCINNTSTYTNQLAESYLGTSTAISSGAASSSAVSDVRKIRSITFDWGFHCGYYEYVTKTFIFSLVSESTTQFQFSASLSSKSQDSSGTDVSYSLSNPSQGSKSYFRLYTTAGGHSDNPHWGYVQVKSFTTTDGKIHTKDNLNY